MKKIFRIIILAGLFASVTFGASSVRAEDMGKIVIILQPASSSGWTNISKINGTSESSISFFNGVAHDSIGKVGGITVNK
jgi:hypothetical protein